MIEDKNGNVINVGDAFWTNWGDVYDVSLEREAFLIENGEGGFVEEVVMAIATSRKTGGKMNLLQFEGKEIQKIEPSSSSDASADSATNSALSALAHCAAELFVSRELFRNGMISEAEYKTTVLEIKEKYYGKE